MSYSPIGDTIALTRLVYLVYNNVIKVAKDAPQQFRELSRDIQTIKGILYRIGDQTSREIDSENGTAVKDVLKRCSETLYGLRDLAAKYEKLGA